MQPAAAKKSMRIETGESRRSGALPLLLAALAAVAYAGISVYRHNHFGSNAFDLGVQDQTVWGYSRLQLIPNTVAMIRNLLGDHFHPILVAVAPLYWLWDDVRVLLVVQALLIAAGGIPIFWWAQQRLGFVSAAAFNAAYLVFWGVLSGIVYDFHHIAFAVPAVSFALYATLTRNNRLLWPMVAVGLLTRENVALTFAAIGLYVIVLQHRWQLGAALAGLCTAWFLLAIEVVMPAIAGTPYGHWTYQALGTGPRSAVLHLVGHPVSSVGLLFNNSVKLKLWGGLLGAWLFLPILSPLFLVAVPTLLERLWSSNPALWSASFHYSLVIAPVLAFASIDTVARLRQLVPKGIRPLAGTGISIATLAAGLILTSGVVRPLDELGTYVSAGQVSAIQTCLNVIPKGAVVSASNALLPHLSHRYRIYLLTMNADADYVAIDLATYLGHFFPGEAAALRATLGNALSNGYGVVCSRGTTVVLHRGGGNATLSPELTLFLNS